MLPRSSFKPRIEAHTTYTGFGVSFGEEWKAASVAQRIEIFFFCAFTLLLATSVQLKSYSYWFLPL